MSQFLPNAQQAEDRNTHLANIAAAILKDKAAEDVWGTPGGRSIIAGDPDYGYYGMVKQSNFGRITASNGGNDLDLPFNANGLAQALGITQGTAFNLNTNWLKYSRKGKPLFVPQLPLRYSISWDHLYERGAIYGTGGQIGSAERFMLDNDANYADKERVPQNAHVKVGGLEFRVRLLRGAGQIDPPLDGNRGMSGIDNEWNNLILPLHERAPSSFIYNHYADTPRPDWGSEVGIALTDRDLLTHHTMGNGSYQWCQETFEGELTEGEGNSVRRVIRGSLGASYATRNESWRTNSYRGWRPALELV